MTMRPSQNPFSLCRALVRHRDLTTCPKHPEARPVSIHWGLDGQLTPQKALCPQAAASPLISQGSHSTLESSCGRQKKHPTGTAARCRVSLQGDPPIHEHHVTFLFSLFDLFSAFFKFCLEFLCICGKKRDFLRTLNREGGKSSKSEEPGLIKDPSMAILA